MKKESNLILRILLFLVIVICINVYWNHRKNNLRDKEKSLSYNGRIEKIRLDDKSIFYVTINGEEYYLSQYPIRGTYTKLEVGDSLVKKKNKTLLKHYKKQNAKYFLYESYEIK